MTKHTELDTEPQLTAQGRRLRRERQTSRVLTYLPAALGLVALTLFALWLGTHGYTLIFK